jgi:hypothetical protein
MKSLLRRGFFSRISRFTLFPSQDWSKCSWADVTSKARIQHYPSLVQGSTSFSNRPASSANSPNFKFRSILSSLLDPTATQHLSARSHVQHRQEMLPSRDLRSIWLKLVCRAQNFQSLPHRKLILTTVTPSTQPLYTSRSLFSPSPMFLTLCMAWFSTSRITRSSPTTNKT